MNDWMGLGMNIGIGGSQLWNQQQYMNQITAGTSTNLQWIVPVVGPASVKVRPPALETSLEWLDRRVEEMRVRL